MGMARHSAFAFGICSRRKVERRSPGRVLRMHESERVFLPPEHVQYI